MRDTREAVRYGIETLGVSPDKMFSLIESSEGYEGDDYQRWLASQIIKIAEKDGVGYSQLLVKKFSIIQGLIDDYSDDSIKEDWITYFKEKLGEKIYSVGLESIGEDVSEFDWFNGIDIDSVNSEFILVNVSEEFMNDFVEDKMSLFAKITSESVDKNSDLYKDAKSRGLVCKSEGALMLYRVCSMVSAFEEYLKDFKFGMICSTNFLYDKDNEDILRYFLSYFDYEGIAVNSADLFENSYSGSELAFIVCSLRVRDGMQDGFVLNRTKLVNGAVELGEEVRYSRSNMSLLEDITCKEAFRSMDTLMGKKPKAHEIGYLYYDYSNDCNCFISSDNLAVKVESIRITDVNLEDVVIYYAVTKSKGSFGMFRNLTSLVKGNPVYTELLYNCVPLFLYDVGNRCRLTEWCDEFNKLLDDGEIYYSYESKELLSVCKSILESYSEKNRKGKTFAELLEGIENDGLSSAYITALTNLKSYIISLYRKME